MIMNQDNNNNNKLVSDTAEYPAKSDAEGQHTEGRHTGGQPGHQRRKRYSGKYPRKFEEKYKEHDPDKYKDTIEKVISKGSTPAGMHIPIMVDEILGVLQIKPGEKGLDCTLGYGGHSSRMAALLSCQAEPAGHLYGLDADPIEIEKTRARMKDKGFDDRVFTAIHTNFRNIDQVAAEYGPFDFILADLGVSSMQIDNPDRGFSYKTEGPLDLRFDPEKGQSAAERLRTLSRDEIAYMLMENADEPYADKIASAITTAFKKGRRIETTTALRELIEEVISRIPDKQIREKNRDEAKKKACARTFQALRIDVNAEMEVLYEFLEKLPYALAPGGRAAILTFHSGEDRLVKKSFRTYYDEGLYKIISKDVTRPSQEECFRNPRARSTKLRWAVKAESMKQ